MLYGRYVLGLHLLGALSLIEASARCNRWGWWYNNGAPLPMERRVNIIAQMLTNGANAAAAAAFCKCCKNTVYKWWRKWNAGNGLEVLNGRRGPPPVLNPATMLYLLCLSEMNRGYRLSEYRERLRVDVGVDASEVRICVALKRLGQHRKAVTKKKIEAQTPHAIILRQRYRLALIGLRIARGPTNRHDYVFIDEMYLNYDDTRVPKARARNGDDAVVLDFDSRGKKYGQLAAMCTAGFFAQFCYPCDQRSTTRDLFEWWLVAFLMPQLRPGCIVVMDRAKFHDPQRTATFLSMVGCGLLMLGPYDSPSNGIEYIHHVEKCYLRRNAAFSRAAPMTALYLAGSMIQQAHCANIVDHVLGF